ncbi:sensor histidine kinase [Marivita sp. S6314]|uniref:sensor histidine kinase n=1 Tax=Marivita sp. S6314 TaxID=2926406 RepID=UPI001FF6DC56|nr:sensor histidine kinase [Marivita sp. S6314]MCK0149521.1 sensor histidine kinase [Marivita sp. S6314]
MTLALLPLGLISIWQTRVVVQEAEAVSRAALLAQTKEAADQERRLVQQALGAAESLASIVTSLDDTQCNAAMQNMVRSSPIYIFAGFLPRNGIMTCSTNGAPIDLSQMPDFETAIQREGPFVEVNLQGAVTGRPVVIVSQPVQGPAGLLGRVSISIPHTLALETAGTEMMGLKVASFNSEGDLIAATLGSDDNDGYLPANMDLKDLALRTGETFRSKSRDGRDRLFAVAPLVEDTLFLVGSWPVSPTFGGSNGLSSIVPILFPALMWLTGLGVAVLGVQHLVLRHLRELRSGMRQFALGTREPTPLDLDNPPQEFEEAQRAFNRMTLILSEAEARQETDLRDKEVLLREVHHRVKNNLQLIASIMNMQMRRATTTEAKQLLSGLQQRVRGLAMLHRTLYTTTDVTTIDSEDLINTVVADASNLIPDHQMEVETDLVSFPLYPDQAVPLSMMIAEALTNAFKYSSSAEGADPVRVVLEEHGNNVARLMITNPVGDPDAIQPDGPGDGLGSQLLKAFIRQLDGTAHSGVRGDQFVFEITFERRNFESDADAA